MHKRTKGIIIGEYGTLYKFGDSLGEYAGRISEVLHGRRKLTPKEGQIWSRKLRCSVDDLAEVIQD